MRLPAPRKPNNNKKELNRYKITLRGMKTNTLVNRLSTLQNAIRLIHNKNKQMSNRMRKIPQNNPNPKNTRKLVMLANQVNQLMNNTMKFQPRVNLIIAELKRRTKFVNQLNLNRPTLNEFNNNNNGTVEIGTVRRTRDGRIVEANRMHSVNI